MKPTEMMIKFAELHRGWCNYCRGDATVCENTSYDQCSLPPTLRAVCELERNLERVTAERDELRDARKVLVDK